MSKYTWDDMTLCKECQCHFADKENPDICHAFGEPREKPCPVNVYNGCGKYIRESKWKRMNESTVK